MDVFTVQEGSYLRAHGRGQQELHLLLTSLTALHRIICFRGKAASKSPYLAFAPVQPSQRISLDSTQGSSLDGMGSKTSSVCPLMHVCCCTVLK